MGDTSKIKFDTILSILPKYRYNNNTILEVSTKQYMNKRKKNRKNDTRNQMRNTDTYMHSQVLVQK